MNVLGCFRGATRGDTRTTVRTLATKLSTRTSSGDCTRLRRLIRGKVLSIGCVSRTITHVLATGFGVKLFRCPLPVRGGCSGMIRTPTRISLTHGVTRRSVILLRGRGGVLPLRVGGLGSVTIVNPGTSRMRFKSCA